MPVPLPSALESMESGNTGWAEAVVCSHPLPSTWGEVASTHAPGSPDKAEADAVVVSAPALWPRCAEGQVWMSDRSQQHEAELSKRKGTGFAKSRRYQHGQM